MSLLTSDGTIYRIVSNIAIVRSPAVLCWKARRVATGRRRAARRVFSLNTHCVSRPDAGMLAHFMVRLYIAVVYK